MRLGVVTEYDPQPGVSISTLAWEYAPNFEVPEHGHGSHQLIYAIRGVMEVASGQSLWMIPPTFAIWIPARVPHHIRMAGAVSMRTLYFRRSLGGRLPAACSVLHVSPLLRELIVYTVGIGELRAGRALHRSLCQVLLSQLEAASPVPTSITLPKDGRGLAVAQSALRELGCGPTLKDLCMRSGISVRTVERVFHKQVGLDFETWRRQARLIKGIEFLAGGFSVKQAAFAVGYRQPSAFVSMFRKTMGATPRAWLDGIGSS